MWKETFANIKQSFRDGVVHSAEWMAKKLSSESFGQVKETLSELLAKAGDNIPKGISIVRDIGVMALDRVQEFATSAIEYLRSHFPSVGDLLDIIMKAVFDSLARVALESVKRYAQQLYDNYKTWVCSLLLILICVCYVSIPSSRRSKWVGGFHLLLTGLMFFSRQYTSAALSATIQTFVQGINIYQNTGRSVFEPQGPKDDFTRVFKSGLVCAVLLKCETAGLDMLDLSPGNIEKLMKRTVLVGRSMQMWDLVADKFGEFFDDLLSVVVKYVCGGEYTSLRRVAEVDEYCHEVLELISLKQSLKVGRDRKMCLRIESLYQRYLILRTKYTSCRKAHDLLNTYGFIITDLYNRVVNKNPNAHTTRKEPVCIVFKGNSGVGKSYLMDTLKQALLKIAGRFDNTADADSAVYSRCHEQEFWDGYTGQPIVVFDDFGQAVDSVANPNLEFFELIRAVNIFPWNLHSANLNEKANNPFNAEFVLLTTNLPIMEPKSIISKDALLRRLHLVVEVELIPEVRRTYTSQGRSIYKLDTERLAHYRAMNNLPQHDRSHWFFVEKDGDSQEEVVGRMDYDQLVVRISQIYQSHQDSYDARQENAEQTRDETLPPGAFSKSSEWIAPVYGPDEAPEDYHDAQIAPMARFIALQDWLANSADFKRQIVQRGTVVCASPSIEYHPSQNVWANVEEYDEWFFQQALDDVPSNYVIFDREELFRALRAERRGAQPFTSAFFHTNAQRFDAPETAYTASPDGTFNAFDQRHDFFAGDPERREGIRTWFENEHFRDDSNPWFKIAKKLFRKWYDFHVFVHARPRVMALMRWASYAFIIVSVVVMARECWKFWMEAECVDHKQPRDLFVKWVYNFWQYWKLKGAINFSTYWNGLRFMPLTYQTMIATAFVTPFVMDLVMEILRHTALHQRYKHRCAQCVTEEARWVELKSRMGDGAAEFVEWMSENAPPPDVTPVELDFWGKVNSRKLKTYGLRMLPNGDLVEDDAYVGEHTSTASDESRKRPPVNVEHTSTASDESRKRSPVDVEHTSTASDESRKRPAVEVEFQKLRWAQDYQPTNLDALERSFYEESERNLTGNKRKPVEVEAPFSTQSTELIGKLKRQLVLIYFQAENPDTPNKFERYLGQCFVVRGHLALINRHYVSALPAVCAEAKRFFNGCQSPTEVRIAVQLPESVAKWEGDIRSITENAVPVKRGEENTEFLLFRLPESVPARACVLSHFVHKGDLAKIQRNTRMFLPVWRKVGNKNEFMIREGLYKRAEDIDLRVEGSYKTYRNSGTIQMSSCSGDCGSPYVINDNLFAQKIVGVHFGGATGEGSFSFITQEDLYPMLKDEIHEGQSALVTRCDQPDDFPLQGAFAFVGRIDQHVHQPTKTNKVRSLIFEQVAPTKVAPSLIRHPLTENGPMINGLMKNAEPSQLLDGILLAQATMNFAQKVALCPAEADDRRVGTFEEGCIGRPGDKAFPPLKRSKGAGFPYCFQGGKGKQKWLGSKEWDLTTPEANELRDDVMALVDECRRGIIPEVMFIDTLKDETRPIEKVRAGKTRVFSAAPLHLSVALRMYFGGWLAFNYRNRIDIEACVGVDARAPASRSEWTKMARRMMKHGDGKVVAGDFSNFDGSLNYYIFDKVREVINDWYCGTREETRIRDVLWRTIVQSKHILHDFVYTFSHGQPSGNNTTAVTNSNYVSIATRYNYALTFGTCKDFNNNVELLAYGDDSLIHVSEARGEKWSPATIARNFAKFGMTFTNESKGEIGDTFRPLSDVTFLKRSFVWCPLANMFMAPLAIDSIVEMTNWVARELPELEAIVCNCEDALLELYHHDAATYNHWSGLLRMALREYDRYLPTFSWRTARSMISSGILSQNFQIETVRV